MKPPLHPLYRLAYLLLLMAVPAVAWSSTTGEDQLDLTTHISGYVALVIFIVSYGVVVCEEFTQLRKSKPVILAASLIWMLIAWQYTSHGLSHQAEIAFRQTLLEFAELFLFLLAAMTYVNAMDERHVFEALRSWLVHRRCSYRLLFWVTGALSFLLSPVIDNLTTSLVMCAVVLAVGKHNKPFISLACINIVIAANAGGAFSPFGDITTLMVWQKNLVHFRDFFQLVLPSAVNWLVPALFIYRVIPAGIPEMSHDRIYMRRGAVVIIFLFAATIATAVSVHSFLGLPPVLGMMTGLAYLQFYGYYLKITHNSKKINYARTGVVGDVMPPSIPDGRRPFDIFSRLARAEWDTLLFFYGVVLSVGGLGFIGYLSMASQTMYVELGATEANIIIGLLSAIIDNIPVMFAVLTMNPDMSLGQWLLVTLTAGVGGSLLSIGSAAGVALMGQARGMYTFFSHMKWAPVIALGYAASIAVHLWLNADSFSVPPGY